MRPNPLSISLSLGCIFAKKALNQTPCWITTISYKTGQHRSEGGNQEPAAATWFANLPCGNSVHELLSVRFCDFCFFIGIVKRRLSVNHFVDQDPKPTHQEVTHIRSRCEEVKGTQCSTSPLQLCVLCRVSLRVPCIVRFPQNCWLEFRRFPHFLCSSQSLSL